MAKGYGSLAGGNTVFAGVDQGIDFTGQGPVYALGEGQVTRLDKSGTGWPGRGALLSYQLTSGPHAGQFIYVAEDFIAKAGLVVGSIVHKGETLGLATGEGAAPGIEVGWADKTGRPTAPFEGRSPTPEGYDFQAFAASGSGIKIAPVPPGRIGVPSGPVRSGSVGDVGGAIGDAIGAVTGAAKTTAADILGTVTGPFEFAVKIWDFFTKGGLVRLFEIVGGALLVIAGLFILARQSGVAIPAPVG